MAAQILSLIFALKSESGTYASEYLVGPIHNNEFSRTNAMSIHDSSWDFIHDFRDLKTDECKDSKFFQADVSDKFITCKTLRLLKPQENIFFCSLIASYSGIEQEVFNFCPETCGLDCAPTANPTLVPSMLPTAGPSSGPSATPLERPSVYPFVTPSNTPSVSPSDHNFLDACLDVSGFTAHVDGVTISCAWLRNQRPSRRFSLCDQNAEFKGYKLPIKRFCPETCGSQCLPTSAPITSPTTFPSRKPSQYPLKAPSLQPSTGPSKFHSARPTDSCKNNALFTVMIDSVSENCESLKKKKPNDLKNICNDVAEYNGSSLEIYFFCPRTCGFDCNPTISPTISLSVTPSEAPSQSSHPSSQPSEECFDDSDFSHTVGQVTVTCLFLRALRPVQRGNLCSMPSTHNIAIFNFCPLTCGYCFGDRAEGVGVSVASACMNNESFVGEILGAMMTCSSLELKKPSDLQKDCIATSFFEGIEQEVFRLCPESCGFDCSPTITPTRMASTPPSPTPSEGPTSDEPCIDRRQFRTDVNGVTISCKFLQNTKPVRRKKLCEKNATFDHKTLSIKNFCPQACGFTCEKTVVPSSTPSTNPSVSPSISPSHIPSFVPSDSPSMTPSVSPTSSCHNDKFFSSGSITCSGLREIKGSDRISICESVVTYEGVSAEIKYFCPDSCGFDCGPTQVPTLVSSDSPTTAPNSLTTVPSKIPSSSPTESSCQDDKEFSYGDITCASIRSQKPVQRETSCNLIINFKGVELEMYKICPQTCGLEFECEVFPTSMPSNSPSIKPSGKQSQMPSENPSDAPSIRRPSYVPSELPSGRPTKAPSTLPSAMPSSAPSLIPSEKPSNAPVLMPSNKPSDVPSNAPSNSPSIIPSDQPTYQPSKIPSDEPSNSPSVVPSDLPSDDPSNSPSVVPSDLPSDEPSNSPSIVPSDLPSDKPSNSPSVVPSDVPSNVPSDSPSKEPSERPSEEPSDAPSSEPSDYPSIEPSEMPSEEPSDAPSMNLPSAIPSWTPSIEPSDMPTTVPSTSCTCVPSYLPSEMPDTRSNSLTNKLTIDSRKIQSISDIDHALNRNDIDKSVTDYLFQGLTRKYTSALTIDTPTTSDTGAYTISSHTINDSATDYFFEGLSRNYPDTLIIDTPTTSGTSIYTTSSHAVNETDYPSIAPTRTQLPTFYGDFSAYDVDVCRCTMDSYNCDEDGDELEANDLLYVCVTPNSTDVVISNFSMRFQHLLKKDIYEIVSSTPDGPKPNLHTAVRGEGTANEPYRVTTRLLPRFFQDDIIQLLGVSNIKFDLDNSPEEEKKFEMTVYFSPPTGFPTSDAPTSDVPTQGPTSESPTEGPTTNVPTEGPTSDSPTTSPSCVCF